jgi:hypothetical protein
MSIQQSTFTATAQTSVIKRLTIGTRVVVGLYGTWTGVVCLCLSDDGQNFTNTYSMTAAGVYEYHVPANKYYRLQMTQLSTGQVGYRVEQANAVTYLGDLEWDDLRVPASGINPIGAVSDPVVDSDETAWPDTLLFSASATNLVAGIVQMPHAWAVGTAIRPHIHWMKQTAGAGAVVWQFYYRISNRRVASEAWVGPVDGVLEVPHNDLADAEAITSFGEIPMAGQTVPSTMLAWRLYRIGGDGADTYAGLARLLELDFHYQKDSLGTGTEFLK